MPWRGVARLARTSAPSRARRALFAGLGEPDGGYMVAPAGGAEGRCLIGAVDRDEGDVGQRRGFARDVLDDEEKNGKKTAPDVLRAGAPLLQPHDQRDAGLKASRRTGRRRSDLS